MESTAISAQANGASPWLFFDSGVGMAGYITQAAAPALLAYYAGLFAAPLSSFQRALITATYVTAGAGLVGAAYVLFGSIYGFVDPFEAHYWIRLTVAASRLFPLLALIANRRRQPRSGARAGGLDDTQREPVGAGWRTLDLYHWVLGTSILGYTLWIQIVNVGSFLAPLGMSYALLNRRLLDFRFRAQARGGLHGGFHRRRRHLHVVEFALSEWLGAGRNANIIAGAILALLLGFSM